MIHTEEKKLSTNQSIPSDKFLIVFDGVCYLCNGFVSFLIRHDKHDRFLFSPLQSVSHLSVSDEIKKNIALTDSIALISDRNIYFRSTAVLEVFRKLGGGWKLFYVFIIFPKPFRDWAYDAIARNRYKWFGKKDVCMMLDEKVKKKFIII